MKAKTLRNGITKIVFEVVIAVAVMVSFLALDGKKVQAKTYQAGETAYVEDIIYGDVINKGAIIMSKDSTGFYIYIGTYDDVFFGIHTNNYEAADNDGMTSWVVGSTIPKKSEGHIPGWYSSANALQMVENQDTDIYGNYYIVLWQSHVHNFYKYSSDKDFIYAHCNGIGNCTWGGAGDGQAGGRGVAYIRIESTSENCAFFSENYLTQFNNATGKSVSEDDLEYYKVNTEGETTGGTKLAGKPTKKGFYYATLTLMNVPDGSGSTGNVTARRAFTLTEDIPDSKPDKEEDKNDDKKDDKKEYTKETSSSAKTESAKVKSVLPQKTVTIASGSTAEDLKVLNVNDKTKVNQSLLVNNFAQNVGKKARILDTFSLHTNRLLGTENGKARTLKWANLEKNPQVVYACCYNQTDKAYFIQGVLDKNGVATFNNFLLRDATNITIFVLE